MRGPLGLRSGKKLTLMNPAYMVRQLHEQQGRTFGVKAHLTSLTLLNPGRKGKN